MVTLEKSLRKMIRNLASGSSQRQSTQMQEMMIAKEQLESMNFTESGMNTHGTLKDKDFSLSQLDSSYRNNIRVNKLGIPEIRNSEMLRMNYGQDSQEEEFDLIEEGAFRKKSSRHNVDLATFGKRTTGRESHRKIGKIQGFNEVVREVERR
jgi:hypothetical protein